ncbi:hypothetical protein_gp288 [Bacillus phage vB_BceM_WH1]|nr:hypothetical protein_gp288 [Bacillus phage vB_BceM_WH1]
MAQIVLVDSEGHDRFVVEVKPGKAYVDFDVEEVVAWGGNDDYYTYSQTEHYLECTIKWDSCCHYHFGNEGYIHMCGAEAYYMHFALLTALYDIAPNYMEMVDELDEEWEFDFPKKYLLTVKQ